MRSRHDHIVRILASLFRQVGAAVHIEPRIYGTMRLRPDLDITLPDKSLMIDVTVAHPAAPSRGSVVPLAAAAAAEKIKYSRYSEFAKKHGAVFYPFAMESYGAFAVAAVKVLKILKRAAGNSYHHSIPASSVGTYAAQVLAVGLQRGNAMVAMKGAVESRAAGGKWN